MKRALLTLLTLVSVASAQTFITVTADTNRIIRTNFSMAISGVTGLQAALDGKMATNATLAISNVIGLQASLDGKLATNGSASSLTNFPALVLLTNSADGSFPSFLLRTNGSASTLSNFPASVLLTNSSLSSFPQGLLRTNGDGSALTNLPNANLSNATGVLPISNGGTGSTNESMARSALGLGSAATNPASAFQPASTALTNLAAGDASGLTNLPNANLGTATGTLGIANGGTGATNAEVARTNFGLVWSGLTNQDAAGFRTALSLGSAATNDASAFQPASANLTNLAANNGGNLTNVSVDLTAVLPSYTGNDGKVLAVATGGTNVAWTAISNTVTDASTLTNFPAIILQTNSADASFPSFLLRTNGSASGLTSFPASILQTNSTDASFPQFLLRTNGDGSALTNLAASNVTGTVALASNVTGTVALATNVSGTVTISNGGTGATTVSNARVNLLPSYSGNALRVLALNSNANDVVWAVDGGGTVDLTSTNVTGTLPLNRGGTGGTNYLTALVGIGVIVDGAAGDSVVLGTSASVGSGNNRSVAIGESAAVTGGANAFSAIAIGYRATNASTQYGIAIGGDTRVGGDQKSIAIGYLATATNGIAIGESSRSVVTNAIQLGAGTNSTATSIQFRGGGSVNETKWSYLANASTKGGSRITNTNGVTVTNVIVGYDGTNFTTNTITVIDGIITEWTQ